MSAVGIETSIYTECSPEHDANEDFVLAGPEFVIVLDGATPVPGLATGCIHDVPWLVWTLGTRLAAILASSDDPLPEVLARAIQKTCDAHRDTCDLSNPDSPSSTVAIIRRRDAELDYLVLADSTVAVRAQDGTVTAITDDRLDYLPSYTVEDVSRSRNTEGGFWVASTDPDAAHQAIAGTLDIEEQHVHSVALLTDGAATLVERHGWTWTDTLDLLDHGPRHLIACTREHDEHGPAPHRAKRHDDATAAHCRLMTV